MRSRGYSARAEADVIAHYLPEGGRLWTVVYNSIVALGVLGLAALLWPDWLWLAAVVAVVAFAWGFLKPLPELTLTSEHLEHASRERRTVIALRDMRAVETRWIAFRDPEVTFIGRSGQISFQLTDSAGDFVRAVGDWLAPRMHELHASRTAAEKLGWPESPRWG